MADTLTQRVVGEVNRVHRKVAESGARCNLSLCRNKVAVHLWSEIVMKDLEFLCFISPKGHQTALHHLTLSIKGLNCCILREAFLFFTDSSITCLGDVINAHHASQTVSSAASCSSTLQGWVLVLPSNAFHIFALVNAQVQVNAHLYLAWSKAVPQIPPFVPNTED